MRIVSSSRKYYCVNIEKKEEKENVNVRSEKKTFIYVRHQLKQ